MMSSHREKLVKTPDGYQWMSLDELYGAPATLPHKQSYGEGKPLKSRALSVHRNQAATFNERAHQAGLAGIHWEDDGTCKITSRRSRNEWMKRYGALDMDAGYGDYSGG
jgi:hypothetical protein